MPKIVIVDDAGNEFSDITVPIPFYIRAHLEEGTTRYRVRLIDDEGYVRGQYSGSVTQSFLELHIPLIKLPKPGRLRILVEESSGKPQYLHQYQISILYLDYTPKKDLQTEEHAKKPFSSAIISSEASSNDIEDDLIISTEVNDISLITSETEDIPSTTDLTNSLLSSINPQKEIPLVKDNSKVNGNFSLTKGESESLFQIEEEE